MGEGSYLVCRQGDLAKNLYEDVSVVMRVLETTLTLNDAATCSHDALDKANV